MGLLRNMLRLSLVVVPTCALAGVAVEALAAVGGVRQGVLAAVLVAGVLHLNTHLNTHTK